MLRNVSNSSGGDSVIKEESKMDLRKISTAKTQSDPNRKENSMVMPTTPSIINKPASGFNGASLVGLLASKRLAKRLSSKFHNRSGSVMSSRLSGTGIRREPTYRMEPYRKFDPHKVEKIIENVVTDRLNGYHYNPKLCAVMSKMVSEDIREKVKALRFDRYKIVTNVVIGQKSNQDMLACSRAIWDDQKDSFASFNYHTNDIVCTVTVYGVYFE